MRKMTFLFAVFAAIATFSQSNAVVHLTRAQYDQQVQEFNSGARAADEIEQTVALQFDSSPDVVHQIHRMYPNVLVVVFDAQAASAAQIPPFMLQPPAGLTVSVSHGPHHNHTAYDHQEDEEEEDGYSTEEEMDIDND